MCQVDSYFDPFVLKVQYYQAQYWMFLHCITLSPPAGQWKLVASLWSVLPCSVREQHVLFVTRTYLLTYLLITYLLLTYRLTKLLTYLFTYIFTYLLYLLLTYFTYFLLTLLTSYFLTYLLTYYLLYILLTLLTSYLLLTYFA